MIYKPEFADQARAMCRLGATDDELAEHFEVCVRTIYRWRNTHEEFAEAVIIGKDHADARVERALYARAIGCTVERTKVFKHAGDPDPVYATYQHHLPPDPVAAAQWLRVRQPRKWGAKPEEAGGFTPARMIETALARANEFHASLEMKAHRPAQPPAPPLPETGAPTPDAQPDPDAQPVPAPDRRPADDPMPEPLSCRDEDTGPPPSQAPIIPDTGRYPKSNLQWPPPPPLAPPVPPPKPRFAPLPPAQRGGYR